MADPDHRQDHEPQVCCGCGTGLADAVWAWVEARQVFDLPPLRLVVTEEFAAIRSYTATAVRQGQNMLDVLIHAADGHP